MAVEAVLDKFGKEHGRSDRGETMQRLSAATDRLQKGVMFSHTPVALHWKCQRRHRMTLSFYREAGSGDATGFVGWMEHILLTPPPRVVIAKEYPLGSISPAHQR